jgi:hypothetical protein
MHIVIKCVHISSMTGMTALYLTPHDHTLKLHRVGRDIYLISTLQLHLAAVQLTQRSLPLQPLFAQCIIIKVLRPSSTAASFSAVYCMHRPRLSLSSSHTLIGSSSNDGRTGQVGEHLPNIISSGKNIHLRP